MARSKTSNAWLAEHFNDEFVKRARKEGYRSRAVYKLQEIDARDRLLKPGMTVVDLGAAPGAWSQYLVERVGRSGRVIALDILPMEALPGVEVLQGDFTEEATLKALLDALGGRPVDLVISDMSPNISGVDSADKARAMYLSELALDFAAQVLKPGGAFLMKVFQGSGFSELYKVIQGKFTRVVSRKPKASRARSAEIYVLATGFRGGESGSSE
ncbi:MAG TPA: 23S rRNA (uridine(2552)-2'-O)-methyltransferase RlmE [Acidiferrobacterales bacterium]|nr:23S rRNA (uridine(2552)-2'-O)-methyltransferase RlmE [Acidiferrobacterales bacterium]